jgi:adenine-specific DNA methylase
MTVLSFIEQQFPVAKVSAEAYKERMAGAGSSQTLTGVGKWWGRKPLVLVRACLFGLLLPTSSDAKRDREIFLKIMTMDDAGLLQRRNKPLPAEKLEELLTPQELQQWLYDEEGNLKPRWSSGLTEDERALVQRMAFNRLTYDEKLDYCHRPEQVDGPSDEAWVEINQHLGTRARSLVELTQALGVRRFGHIARVGDPVCGGGSIPFEAARLGCDVYASDLSPVAALLTWGALHLVGGDDETRTKVHEIQLAAYDATLKEIDGWGLETNNKGWRHEQLYYVVEMRSPATGLWVPVAPSFVISERYKVCAVLRKNAKAGNYDIEVVTGASAAQMAAAKRGTLRDSRVVCPETGNTYAVGDLRGDRRIDGDAAYGLRMWNNDDLVPRPDDVMQERLYCVRWAEEVWVTNARGEQVRDTLRHFKSVTQDDLDREAAALALLKARFSSWQAKGYIPRGAIPRGGEKTEEPIRTRGWTHWHHLFTPRQLLMLGSFAKNAVEPAPGDPLRVAASCLGVGAALERLSRLCGVDPHISKGPGSTANVFFNQALNPLMNFGSRQLAGIKRCLCGELSAAPVHSADTRIALCDARAVESTADIWFTDPPYADAVNYHELTYYFLAWYERLLPSAFPTWHVQDGSSLAVQGSGENFKRSMVDIYGRLARQMPDDGLQLVQFTHQNPAVWGDLGMILWASGLQVTAAWTIATETSSGGLKKGNYVQGTVNLVLRKRSAPRSAWLDEIYPLVEDEVKRQLDSMLALDDESDPNFGDTDYQLAAYAAALRVLTQFSEIEGMDIAHELGRERTRGEKSEFEKLIDRAVEIAADHLIPRGFEEFHWKGLSAPERLYLKGLELERHREARGGAYQELAKGFGVREYTSMYERSQPNAVRFKTASEFKRQQLGDDSAAGSFGSSLLRHVLYAIHETVREENARVGLDYLKTDGAIDYWGKRKAILAMLAYLKPLAHVAHMPHWQADADAAERLAGVVENDH